jgi:hypothetical protein
VRKTARKVFGRIKREKMGWREPELRVKCLKRER